VLVSAVARTTEKGAVSPAPYRNTLVPSAGITQIRFHGRWRIGPSQPGSQAPATKPYVLVQEAYHAVAICQGKDVTTPMDQPGAACHESPDSHIPRRIMAFRSRPVRVRGGHGVDARVAKYRRSRTCCPASAEPSDWPHFRRTLLEA